MHGSIRNAQGEALDYTFSPGAPGGPDLVVLGHGVTANKDRPFLVALANELGRRGIATLRFSFAGNGASEGRFEESTVTKEVADLGAVLDACGDRRIAYIGHSMGGAVGVLRARDDARIRVLVSLAGMVDTAGFAQRKFGHLVPGASAMWDKPECPLSQAYMDDMARIGSVADQARGITVPWLLVHGTADEVVPIADAELAQRCASSAELVRLDGVDHVFSGDAATAAMVECVAPWLASRFR